MEQVPCSQVVMETEGPFPVGGTSPCIFMSKTSWGGEGDSQFIILSNFYVKAASCPAIDKCLY